MKNFVTAWKNITTDPEILDIVQHYHINFKHGSLPVQERHVHQNIFNEHEQKIVDSELEKLLQMNVIKEASYIKGQFLSPIFLRPKKNGEYRLILNLKKFNEWLPYFHFKMDTFETTLKLVTKDMYMCSIDIRHAYYSIGIAKEHQMYLRFQWRNKIYQFTALPNGLAHGPLVFTRLLKPVYATLRNKGHISSGFIDDSFLGGKTVTECELNVHDTVSLMTSLGFMINKEKSVMIPTKKIVHLGFWIDSELMIVYLPDEKKVQIISKCQELSFTNRASIRQVAQVIGLMVAAFPAVEYGKLHYRSLEMEKSSALKRNRGNFEAKMTITISMKNDLYWWINNVHRQVRVIDRGNPEVVITTDSSYLGWGFVHDNVTANGRWTSWEKSMHINVLEIKAILFAIKALAQKLAHKHVKILSDSTTAVCYINNMGGCKSVECNDLSKTIWQICIEHSIWLTCAHIAGKENVADLPSRQFNDNIEWELRSDVFEKMCNIWSKPNIDLFASRLNHKLDLYCAYRPDPGAAYIDAFTLSWSDYDSCYIFCPFSLINRCIRKIISDKARAVMVVPLWPAQLWFPVLLRLLVDYPRLLPTTKTLLQLKHLEKTHPMGKRLKLIACRVSGVHSETKDFQRKLPQSYFHLGELQLGNNTKVTSTGGYLSAINGKVVKYIRL